MSYVLTMLTNGRQECFERSAHAFFQHVRPLPDEIYVFDDGAQTGGQFVQDTIGEAMEKWAPDLASSRQVGVYDSSPASLGMCAAHQNCHDAAAQSNHPLTFHLEDDFVILRPVDLRAMTYVLEQVDELKQIALVRCPWGREIEFGGYIPQMPGLYERMETLQVAPELVALGVDDRVAQLAATRHEWIATTRNWATNPALMHTATLREFPWSPVPGCETEIGPRIIEKYPDAVFGLWGWGEPWAAHIALERQPGAHGY